MLRRTIAAAVLITCFWAGWTMPAQGQNLGKLLSDGQSVSGHAHLSGNAGVVGAGVNVPMWPGFFFFNGVRYNFTMVGSDPTVVGNHQCSGSNHSLEFQLPERYGGLAYRDGLWR